MNNVKKNLKKISTVLLCMVSYLVTAQDLVVTAKNDSINAQITKEKDEMLYFNFVKNGEVRKTLLPLEEVKSYTKKFFKESEVPKDYKSKSTYTGPRFRMAVQGGLAFRLGSLSDNIEPALRDHAKNLKSGYSWGFDGHYLLNEYIGVGVKYTMFGSTHEEKNITVEFPDNTIGYGIDETIYTRFVGPSVLSRVLTANGKNAWVSGIALGQLFYRSETTLGGRNFIAEQATFGMSLDFGYDIYLSEKWSLGIATNLFFGSLTEVDLTGNDVSETLELDERESLSRIDFSVGLRWLL